ncbi:MAG TPA: hypothetical protein DCE44_07805, partial [Verrucomicrobiales bacterium]|nr:hypothetical protein [Verrucomicrobiales bacterium]
MGRRARLAWTATLVVFLVAGPRSAANPTETSSSPGEYLITRWQAEDGLPQSTVTSVVQTRDGYLWLGTLNGLARFDGIRFMVLGAHNTPALKSNRILALLEDRAGGLWIGTEGGGVTRWYAGRFTTYTIWEGLAHDTVQCLAEDSRGQVLIGTLGGLSLWHEGQIQSHPGPAGSSAPVRAAVSTPSGRTALLIGEAIYWREGAAWRKDADRVGEDSIEGLYSGPGGQVWAFGGDVLKRWAKDAADKAHVIELPSAAPVGATLETARGDMWVGTRFGVLLRWRVGAWRTILNSQDLGQHPVRCLLEDREGNIWVGTDGGGLARLKSRRLDIVRPHRGTVTETIRSLASAPDGGVWLAAACGGLSFWRGDRVEPFDADGMLKPNVCAGPLLRTRDGCLWIGTSGDGLYRWNGAESRKLGSAEGFSEATILSLFEDREERLWIGTAEAGVFQFHQGRFRHFTTRDGFPARLITAIVQDAGGDLWIGSNGGGLYRYADGKFSLYSRREGWGGDFIRTLHVDGEGALWIGSGGGGLTRMKDGWFHTITTRDGLSDDIVSQILEDDFGNLWVGTNRGICRFNKREFEALASGKSRTVAVVAYGKSDGMESLECTGGLLPAALKTSDGALWFSTVKGAVRVEPGSLLTAGEKAATAQEHSLLAPPIVVIEEVWSDGARLLEAPLSRRESSDDAGNPPAVPRLVVQPGYQNLEIRYTALTFTAPEKARFRYQLE